MTFDKIKSIVNGQLSVVQRKLRGFTLVELLVVITIISILTGTSAVVYNNVRDKGRDSDRKQDLAAIKGALALYFQDNGSYPCDTTPPAACGDTDFVSNEPQPWIPALVSGGYIQNLPVDPKQLGFGPLRPQVAAVSAVDLQVLASSDDAYESVDTGSINLTRSFVKMEANTTPGNREYGGFRFTNVNVARGATINSAYLELNVLSADDIKGRIVGQKSDAALTFSSSAFNITSRPETAAQAAWSATNLGTGWKQTPDLASIIQEIVNQSGWIDGSPIVLMVKTGSDVNRDLQVRSYDDDPTLAAKLHIEYTVAAPSPPTVDIKANSSDGPITVTSGDTVVLSWTVTNSPTSCSASGAWSGAKSTSGGAENVVVTASGTYTLTCTNAGGEGSDSVTVNVSVPSPPPSLPPSPPSSPPPAAVNTYMYVVASDRKSYTLWAQLENTNDPQINTKAGATCRESSPSGSSYNYCLKPEF